MTSKKNLDIILYEKIHDQIINGKWKPGEKLDIDELAEFFEVSRTPVIQAIKMMIANDMIMMSGNGKVSLPEYTKQEIIDICNVRFILENQAIKEIDIKSKLVDIISLKYYIDSCIKFYEIGDFAQARKIDSEFHTCLVRQAGNNCLNKVFAKIQAQFTICHYLLVSPNLKQRNVAIQDHKKIVQLLESKNYTEVENVLEEHITVKACKDIVDNL